MPKDFLSWWAGLFSSDVANSGTYQTKTGDSYYWLYQPAGRNTPAKSTISIDQDIPFDFAFDKEGSGEKLAKWLGFASEFQTGDQVFDDLVYIDCEYEPFCQVLASVSEMREAISQLLQTYAKSITARKGRLTITLINPMPTPENSIIEAIVPQLCTVRKLIPTSCYTDYIRPSFTRVNLSYCVFAALLAGGILAGFVGVLQSGILLDKLTFFLMTCGYSLVLILLSLAAIAYVFKGSPRGYDALKQFLPMGTVGILLLVGGIIYNMNIWFDNSPPDIRIRHIVSKDVSHSVNHGDSYSVSVDDLAYSAKQYQLRGDSYSVSVDWRGSENSYDLRVNKSFYDQVNPQTDFIQLELHPGLFHLQWIKSYSLIHGN